MEEQGLDDPPELDEPGGATAKAGRDFGSRKILDAPCHGWYLVVLVRGETLVHFRTWQGRWVRYGVGDLGNI
jgi:hypothetical protein